VLTGTPRLLYKPTGTVGSGTFEGPVWVAGKSVLLFSDVTFTTPVNPAQMFQLTPPETTVSFMTDSGTNGMAVDGNGVVYACSHKVQGIVKLDYAAAKLTTVVDNYQGKKFNSPNDLVLRSDGTIYFTDPDFQLGSRTSETSKKGVYRVSPTGTVALVDDTFQEPNGISLSPDETILYVADYNGNAIRTFKVAADGSTSERKDFVTVTSPDGLAVDCLGNLYVASGGLASTIQVYSPSGSKIASLAVGSSLSNLAFGGSDGKTLYITAGKALYSLDMNLPGYSY
jgi:gluconolactonase